MFARHVHEHGESSPLKEAFTENKKEVLQGTLFASGYGVLFYLTLIYLPTWASQFTSLRLDQAMWFNTLGTALLVPMILLGAWVSDRFVRRTHLLIPVMLAFAVLALPLQLWMATGSLVAVAFTQVLFAILIGIPCGVGPALFVELFPTRDRLSGYSVAFNVGMGLVGGSTPAAVTWLISETGLDMAPAFYMIAAAVLAAATLAWMHDRSREPLS